MPKIAASLQGEAGTLGERVAGAVAYVTFIPAIIFLFLKGFKKTAFVRFHAVQCLLLWCAGTAAALLLRMASHLMALIPVIGPPLVFLISVLAILAAGFLWLVLIVKALQGEMFKLPWLGEFAAAYSGE